MDYFDRHIGRVVSDIEPGWSFGEISICAIRYINVLTSGFGCLFNMLNNFICISMYYYCRLTPIYMFTFGVCLN